MGCLYNDGAYLSRSELGDGLGALGDGVLGQLAGQHQADGGLHFSARQGRSPIVAAQSARLGGQALEHIVDKGVHDAHATLAHTGLGVHLLEHPEDIAFK